MKFEKLNNENLPLVCERLTASDLKLKSVYIKYGAPPLWDREPNFATLIHIILEQQVSLASALAAFNKLKERIGKITPENVLKLNDDEMKLCYFSIQKTGYARNLAKAITRKRLIIGDLQDLPDEEVGAELMKIKGIGRWTADIFLIMALLRPDVMPKGDLALHAAYQKLYGLENRPGSDEFIEIAKKWKPYRSVAARLLWHFYLSG